MGRSDMTIKKRFWVYLACQFGGWLGQAGINAFFTAMYTPLPAVKVAFLGLFLCGGLTAILVTHLYREWVRHRNWTGLRFAKLIPRVLFASVVLGCLITALVTAEWAVLIGVEHFGPTSVWLAPALIGWSSSVLFWNIIYFAVSYYDRYRATQLEKARLENIAKEAQLQRLVAQVNPHFMFNCLNSLRALISENPAKARQMVTDLADLLRYALQSGKKPLAPLKDELEVVNTYLNLERIRFEERLTSHIEASPEALSVLIPSMLLQSLVENGLKHGIEKLPQGGEISLTARTQDGQLNIRLANTGVLQNGGNSTGIGLENARERLRLMYGERASLALSQQGTNRVLAEITIPIAAVPA